MATTYTTNARLQKPATSDRNWDIPINANADTLDAISAIGGLAVTTTESPSETLQIGVAAGNFISSDGTVASYSGVAAYPIAAFSTTYLWLTDDGTLTSGSSFPTSAHMRLAHVVSGTSSVMHVVDERVSCSVVGTGLGFVRKAGDTMTGPLTVAVPGAGPAVFMADSINRLIGFFGTPPASQASALTPLVSSSSGVASDTLADVGTSFSQSVLNNNFASLVAKVDALIVALQRHGLMGS